MAPARTSDCQFDAVTPAARARFTSAWTWSMKSAASSCRNRRSASFRSQSISADWRMASHMVRDERRSPPSASVVAASDRRNHGAPSTLLARSNQLAAAA